MTNSIVIYIKYTLHKLADVGPSSEYRWDTNGSNSVHILKRSVENVETCTCILFHIRNAMATYAKFTIQSNPIFGIPEGKKRGSNTHDLPGSLPAKMYISRSPG